jgi:hypothetical protein
LVNCADRDGLWENGCELATNKDYDYDGVFMNEGDVMDCSVMEAEAVKNPELFRHHLHIDLTKAVPTVLSRNLPAGSIFCDNSLADPTLVGKCFFMCIDGFANVDRTAFNGCEGRSSTYATYWDDQVADGEDTYNGAYHFGGYLIGDPHVEEYFYFLEGIYTDTDYTDFLTFTWNVDGYKLRENSDFYYVEDSDSDIYHTLWY